MGIQGLLNRLQPYATEFTFYPAGEVESLSTTTSTIHDIVVDGPALAHHIFYEEILTNGTASTFISTLSYREIGSATIKWLRSIELYNARIAAIYFDGGLPETKRKERLNRLESSLQRSISFKSQKNTNARAWALGTFPPPPFLVPAVIEALLASEFSHVTSLVDGEADSYCAEFAKSKGGLVITSDSDLVVYDLGSEGAVIYLNDLGTHLPKKDHRTSFTVPCYKPKEIAKRLHVSSMVFVAFELVQDPYKSAKQCATAAQKNHGDGPEFLKFANSYQLQATSTPNKSTYVVSHRASPAIKVVDPRISEYLLHSGVSTSMTLQVSELSQSNTTSRIYLPVLLDDPGRSSPWQAGQYFRQLGYSIVRLCSTPGVTREFARNGMQIAGNHVEPLSQSAIASFCDSFVENIEHINGLYPSLDPNHRWRLFGTKYVCETRRAECKLLPMRKDMEDLLIGRNHGLDWGYIHLSSELQAVLYSVRMLQQFVTVFLALREDNSANEQCLDNITALYAYVSTLPSLAELIPAVDEALESLWKSDVQALLEDIGVDKQPDINSKKARKRKERVSGMS